MPRQSGVKRSEGERSDERPGRHFVADARVVLSLGRDSIKDKATAVLELVKNSYDAGATVVDIHINASGENADDRFIRISDDGHGMTSDDLDGRYLWIGFSAKRESPTYRGRRRIGEKGIGRLSADRLGAVLELRSQAKKESAIGVTIDWSTFETTKTPLTSIEIPEIDEPTFDVPKPWLFQDDEYEVVKAQRNGPSRTGTELTIRQLRQDWDAEEIESLWRDLSLLTSPFRSTNDFQIRLSHDFGDIEAKGVVESSAFQSAQTQAEFTLTDNGAVNYTLQSLGNQAEAHTETWATFYQRGKSAKSDNRNSAEVSSARPFVGPLKVILYFYVRKSTPSMSALEISKLLDRMAGVKVYRDGIRVMPYGDNQKEEGGDWLGLGQRKTANPAGAARKTFRVGPSQLVGAVFISSDANPNLRDTSAREGLVHDDAFRELRAFVLGCILRLEAHYHTEFLRRKKSIGTTKSPRKAALDFRRDLKELRLDLNSVKSSLPSTGESRIDEVTERIETAVSQITLFSQTIDELASQATIYRGLASVGIAAVVFSHETDVSLDQFQAAAIAARNILKHRFTLAQVPTALAEVEKAIAEAKKISTWGKFALRRVKADKRRKKSVDLGRVISELVKDLRTVFRASSIELTPKIGECQGRAFQMDVESIVLNLLTNAYTFAKLTRAGARKVELRARPTTLGGRRGLQIRVSDSGPGVAPALRDRIWTPLFTTKEDENGRPTGTGLGLAIIDDIVTDNNGARKVDSDPDLGGARFTVWIPLP
jgi:signal transduction histidine kinase